ncbi:vWA domain-containing protein [Rhizobium sp. SL86]|uniref:vWA domain-containing protein n=1 Tax=Rhizobium sp. SL86 TaxID=2995148 RepID=UPI0022769B4E|nr:VWA domain-containing protein [Rhizobium sp. SL86]MCY1666636.1 VWA domain-containing protein [Rhizobium sp. SL86]
MSAMPKAEQDLGDMMRARLSGFVRTLRDNGFVLGLSEVRDALAVLASPVAAGPSRFRPALRSLFCSRHSDWVQFDEIFDAFWLRRGMKSATRMSGAPQKTPDGVQAAATGARGLASQQQADHVQRGEGTETVETGQTRREGASRADFLGKTDFRHLTDPDDLAEAHRLAERLAVSMRARMTRRMRARARGQRLDLRRTIHKSIANGGTPMQLVFRKRREKPLRLVVLLDGSGSMSLYSAVFLRFMHGVLDAFREAEAFLFHTRLVHISPALRERDPERAVQRMALMGQGTGGGTRIGESLATFNRWHAKRCIHSRTCVMIVSDGYDTGPAERLGEEMQALRRRCRRIAWLNPMIGWRDYAPEAAGMKAALPFIDLFAPAHNLESLEALEPYLARI